MSSSKIHKTLERTFSAESLIRRQKPTHMHLKLFKYHFESIEQQQQQRGKQKSKQLNFIFRIKSKNTM
jgi:hypothetical protein